MEEKWIQVVPYLKNGTIRECGSKNKKTKACRPLNRTNDKTPITIKELVKLHGKDEVLRLASKKKRYGWSSLLEKREILSLVNKYTHYKLSGIPARLNIISSNNGEILSQKS